jgi:excisionase family DNA binding protein
MERLLLNMREAGEALACSPWTVRRKIYRGEIPGVKVGTRLCVERVALEDFIREHRTDRLSTGERRKL